jgi:hypothetical protein
LPLVDIDDDEVSIEKLYGGGRPSPIRMLIRASATKLYEPHGGDSHRALFGSQTGRPHLDRVAFKTSRLAEFCGEKELVAQTGHAKEDWPLVIPNGLVDNALDECEEAKIGPEIDVTVSTETGEINITDNGRGMPALVVRDLPDYSYRVSFREAYVSPTRGAQGNALKTLVAMPFALHGKTGRVAIEAQGVRHATRFGVDQLRQRPAIDHEIASVTAPRKGTQVTVSWPDSACSILAPAEARFLQIADDFNWINPHLRIRVSWNGRQRVRRDPSNLAWEKWRAWDQTSAHWYDLARLERYIAARIGRDQDRGCNRRVREFISEL